MGCEQLFLSDPQLGESRLIPDDTVTYYLRGLPTGDDVNELAHCSRWPRQSQRGGISWVNGSGSLFLDIDSATNQITTIRYLDGCWHHLPVRERDGVLSYHEDSQGGDGLGVATYAIVKLLLLFNG